MLSKFSNHRLALLQRVLLRRFSNIPVTNSDQPKEDTNLQTTPTEKMLEGKVEGRDYAILPEKPQSEFGPGKDPYSTFPEETKHLLHRRATPLTQEEQRTLLIQRLEEAKSKVIPIEMSEEDRKKYLKSKEELMKDKEVIFIDPKTREVLDNTGISLEVLRKLQDKHYEIDLDYEKNRDLYEKQRVTDNFLQEHDADNQMLNSYYSNAYKKAKSEKFNYFAFVNTYDPKDLRFHYQVSLATTLLTTAGLFLVHPALPLLLLYDYYLLLGFTKVLNQTTFAMVLESGKRHIFLNRLNFLGYQTEFKEDKISLRSVRFLGEYTNRFITLDNKGLLPSISRLMNAGGKKEFAQDFGKKMGSAAGTEEKKEEENEVNKDHSNFKYFWKFAADNETFLIPRDHKDFKEGVIDEQLLLDLINGRQNKVQNFDFSEKEQEYEYVKQMIEVRYQEIMDKYGDKFVHSDDIKRRQYSYFMPNREFSGHMENMKLKKADDGTFIDNGYR